MDGLVSCSLPDIYDNRDGSYISEVCKYVLCIIGPLRLVKTFFSESVEVKEVVVVFPPRNMHLLGDYFLFS